MKKFISILVVSAFVALAAESAILAQGNSADVSAQRERGQTQAQQGRDNAQQQTENVKQQAEDRKAAIKQEVEERRAQIKQEVCERRQAQLNTVIPRLATGTKTLKSTFDTIYERVQSFYDDGQLTVANYDELKASADASQADAAAAVETVSSYQFELDCSNPNVGEQLDGFRQAVSEARTALKAYQEDLVQLISALRAEASQQQADNSDNDTAESNLDNQGVRNEE